MKKFITTLGLFVILFFLIDKLFYWKLEELPKREVDKRLEWILEGKINKDILIFGSSRAQHNIYSDAIQDSLQLTVFNLGYRGCNINFQLFLLKTVLKHNKKPKIIILAADEYREFLPEKTLQFRYDKLYPLVKYQEITQELVVRKEVSPFAIGFYCARIGWEQFSKPKAITKYDHWTKTGTALLDFTAADFDAKRKPTVRYKSKLEMADRLCAFTNFQEICDREKIQLCLVVPPNYSVQNQEFVTRLKSLVRSKNTLFYADISPEFKNSNYFSDRSHLNKKGALLYTNQIIKKLNADLRLNSIKP